jgi:hypothetical protein
MADVRFEWDPRRSRANKAKHGVSFEEACYRETDQVIRIIRPSCGPYGAAPIRRVLAMKKRYDFSKSKPNPYLQKRKRQITT